MELYEERHGDASGRWARGPRRGRSQTCPYQTCPYGIRRREIWAARNRARVQGVFSARRINEIRNTSGATVWQRNYYERIVRNERKLNAARNDILGNPANWTRGVENRDFWGSVAGRNG